MFDLEKNLRFLQLLVSSGLVNRVFVDPVIKARLCDFATSIGERSELTETLRRLRPWPLHGDHFHVRLHCPKGSKGCVVQAPVPAGDGCAEAGGASLRLYPHLRSHGVMSDSDAQDAVRLYDFERQAEEGPGC